MKTLTLKLCAGLLLLSQTASPAAAGRYDGVVKALNEFMGGGASVKRFDDQSRVFLGNNGNRFRVDMNGHGDKPHFHLETQKPNGSYQPATGTQHREYFSD